MTDVTLEIYLYCYFYILKQYRNALSTFLFIFIFYHNKYELLYQI